MAKYAPVIQVRLPDLELVKTGQHVQLEAVIAVNFSSCQSGGWEWSPLEPTPAWQAVLSDQDNSLETNAKIFPSITLPISIALSKTGCLAILFIGSTNSYKQQEKATT